MSSSKAPWIAVGLALGLGLVYWGWVVKIKPRRAKAAEDAKILFKGLDPAGTTEILLRKSGSADVLLRRVDGQWRLISPTAAPADADSVGAIVGALASAKRGEVVAGKGANLADFGLDKPSGEVTFKPVSPGAKAQVLFFGMNNPMGDQAYALLDGDPRVFLADLSLKNSVLKTAADLRDKTVWTFDPANVEAVRSGISGFSLRRTKLGQWEVDTPRRREPAKGNLVGDWLGELSRFRADSVPSETGAGHYGLRRGKSLTLTLKDGAELSLVQGGKAKQGADFYVQPAGKGPVFALPLYERPVLGRKGGELMDLNVLSFDTGAVRRFEVRRGGRTLVAVRSKNGSWSWQPPLAVRPGRKPFDFPAFLSGMANSQLLKRLDPVRDRPLTPSATVTFFGDDGALLEKAVFGARMGQGIVVSSAMKNQTVVAPSNLLDTLPQGVAPGGTAPVATATRP